MSIGKLYHYSDPQLNVELQRIYDYISQGQINSNDINVPEVAAKISGQIPFENVSGAIPHTALRDDVRESFPDSGTISLDIGSWIRVPKGPVVQLGLSGKPTAHDVSQRHPVIIWNGDSLDNDPTPGPEALPAGYTQEVKYGTLLSELDNDAVLVLTDSVGRAGITVTPGSGSFSTLFHFSYPWGVISTSGFSWPAA